MAQRELSIVIPEPKCKVSAILERPPRARAILVLAHGAGAGMRHPFMAALAKALADQGIATLRFNFCYMENGSRRPDRPDVARAAVAAAVKKAARIAPRLPILAGGKSFGGRMTTQAAAAGEIPTVRAVVCFGFPLHPPKRPSVTRAEHLAEVAVPVLFISGTRDDLADLKLLKPVVARRRKWFRLHVVEGADHGFSVLKSSGRTPAEVLAEIAGAVASFCRGAL